MDTPSPARSPQQLQKLLPGGGRQAPSPSTLRPSTALPAPSPGSGLFCASRQVDFILAPFNQSLCFPGNFILVILTAISLRWSVNGVLWCTSLFQAYLVFSFTARWLVLWPSVAPRVACSLVPNRLMNSVPGCFMPRGLSLVSFTT